MHAVKLNVGDSLYAHLMFLLKNLNPNEIQIIEDAPQGQDKDLIGIDMSNYRIDAFKVLKTL